ncbi:CRISPR-associated protein, Csy3 family [Selenomonas ruminantium]|uniref:CRISPR-associated protein, Csy3 family n=1 Tax=Selenomonas ruminantium TaxID=971 RepID=A0A1I3BRW8_SELRU|nr:type I-F CRISPR-associated protein Csy3 [Selenomonas ruminantium]SFH65044.1 CRISPR-associated protein, Csy3 family [Selenomonas ruminantium]
MAKKDVIPSVLSFEKKLVVSDGYMYGTVWTEGHDSETEKLRLVEKSVRGTISNRLEKVIQNDPAKLNAKVENANLQQIDSCALGMDKDTLKLSFTIKVLGGLEKPSACNNADFAVSYADAVKNYLQNTGCKELAYRYAYNIACGRFLWRNRLGAEKIDVVVRTEELVQTFDAYGFSLRDFEENTQLEALTAKIADVLSGKRAHLFIEVDAYARLGTGQEVYPSEELVFDKGNSRKSKILYQVNGVAAMHSQKLGNALRTIDTWYPDFATEAGVGPIAIEPYGAVTNLGKAFRNPKEKVDFYTLFDKFALGEKLSCVEEEHYVMAVLVRGGVFGKG